MRAIASEFRIGSAYHGWLSSGQAKRGRRPTPPWCRSGATSSCGVARPTPPSRVRVRREAWEAVAAFLTKTDDWEIDDGRERLLLTNDRMAAFVAFGSAPEPRDTLQRFIGLRSASALVVANVVGAGIFTTTGFQAAALGNPRDILALWVVGGLLAFAGALCYAELGASMPRAGGEYVYLRETYGPALGFMSAVVSLVAGFSAPIASAAKGACFYLAHFVPALGAEAAGGVGATDLVALAIVWALIAIQLRGARAGVRFGDAVTAFEVGGVLAIMVAAFAFGRGRLANFAVTSASYTGMSSTEWQAALGTSLVFVMFCYSGWNASAYVASELRDPRRDLPRSLLLGTGLVVVLYLGINAVYFYGADVDALAGRVEVGLVAARQLFGPVGASAVSLVLVVSLLASASAMTIAGPRVYFAVGRDFQALRCLATVRPGTGTPVTALLVQGVVTSLIVLSGRVDQIMQYAGFTLSLFASLAVSCVLVLRVTRPELPRPFRTWGHPVTPLLFLAVSGWMMFWAFRGRPVESGLGLATVVLAGLLARLGAWRRAATPRPG
jgi:APA family basic amino acid/polyamine antiporter